MKTPWSSPHDLFQTSQRLLCSSSSGLFALGFDDAIPATLTWKGPTSLWSSCLHSLSIMVEVAHHGEIVRDVTVPLMTRQTHASSQPLHSKSTNTTSVEPKMRTSAIRTNALHTAINIRIVGAARGNLRRLAICVRSLAPLQLRGSMALAMAVMAAFSPAYDMAKNCCHDRHELAPMLPRSCNGANDRTQIARRLKFPRAAPTMRILMAVWECISTYGRCPHLRFD